jgi:hypothetical protein
MQSGETAPTSPVVAFAMMLEEAGAPRNLIRPVLIVLCTVTVSAGTLALESVTPETVDGKLSVTVSAAVPPKPLNRA